MREIRVSKMVNSERALYWDGHTYYYKDTPHGNCERPGALAHDDVEFAHRGAQKDGIWIACANVWPHRQAPSQGLTPEAVRGVLRGKRAEEPAKMKPARVGVDLSAEGLHIRMLKRDEREETERERMNRIHAETMRRVAKEIAHCNSRQGAEEARASLIRQSLNVEKPAGLLVVADLGRVSPDGWVLSTTGAPS